MSILSGIMNMVTPVIIDRVAAALGINSTIARTAINLALPAILGAFANKAATPAGASDLFRAVGSADAGLFGSIGNALSGAGKDDLINSGTSTMNNLLGSGTVTSLANSIGTKAGLGGGIASMLLPLVGQMALSGLAKTSAGKDASGLASMLASEAASFGGATPRAAQPVHTPPVAAAPGGMGMMRWLLPLVALAAVLWYFMGGSGVDEKAMMDKAATTAMPSLTVEGVDVGKQMTSVFGTLQSELAAVKDVATAQTALPKIQDAAKSVDAVAAVAGKFSAEQKTAVGAMISAALPAVRAVADKAMATQGVGDILKPVIDGLFAKIDAMAK